MPRTYSTYEAKAKLSEILRQVRQGATVTISYHGEPVAEIRPVRRGIAGLADRLRELEVRGVVVGPGKPPGRLRPLARRRGALARFLRARE